MRTEPPLRPSRLSRRIGVALALALLSCAGPRGGGPGGAASEVRTLAILSTGDTWGELEPCG